MANVKKVVGNNFDPYLVGLQFTSEGGTPLFTVGNFQVSTNLTPPPKRNFQLGSFSEPLTLENLGSTLNEASQLVEDNLSIFLNLDTKDLLSFTLFGSFQEFVNVTLNNVYFNWPASIYVYYSYGSVIGTTFNNYIYDPITNTSTFDVSTNFFYNYYNLNFLQNALSYSGTSMPATIRNLTTYYTEYVIYVNNSDYRILNFVGSSTISSGICYFTVQGDPFGGVSNTTPYHIKPNQKYLDRFFSNIDDFTRFLLNRNSVPQYTSTIYYEEITENNFKLQRSRTLSWPVSDGYNLDWNTANFLVYKNELLAIAKNYDEYKTDLMRRVLVTESVSYSELNPVAEVYYPLNTTDKIEKLLHIYGREFDEIKKYIQGISFAATVSYDKLGNTPDAIIKDFAYYLGWDMLSPMDENKLLSNFTPSVSFYSGMTVGYTPAEAEVEFWRRLILNSSFLWKSKGTRKGIEFIFEFINTPPALVHFNEYIYQAKNKLNVNLFRQILSYLYNNDSIETFNIDEDGYPKIPQETLNNYFQKGGGWYRETAGSNSQIDLYEGNNPHVGPYDGGQYYIDKFRCLLENFSGQTIKITEEYVEFTNIFANYYGGNVTGYEGDVFLETVDSNNRPSICSEAIGTVITNPTNEPELNICGCPIPTGVTNAILISVNKKIVSAPICNSGSNGSSGLNIIGGLGVSSGVGNSGSSGSSGVNSACNNLLFLYPYVWADISDPTKSIITSKVPESCCLSVGGTYNSTTNECGPNKSATTAPCSSNLIFTGVNSKGQLTWFDKTTNSTITIVPQSCCTYYGGVPYPNGECFRGPSGTSGSSGNVGSSGTSGTSGIGLVSTYKTSWQVYECTSSTIQAPPNSNCSCVCGCDPANPANPLTTIYTNDSLNVTNFNNYILSSIPLGTTTGTVDLKNSAGNNFSGFIKVGNFVYNVSPNGTIVRICSTTSTNICLPC